MTNDETNCETAEISVRSWREEDGCVHAIRMTIFNSDKKKKVCSFCFEFFFIFKLRKKKKKSIEK